MDNHFEFTEIVLILSRLCNKKECIYCQVDKNTKSDYLQNNSGALVEFCRKIKISRIRFLGGESLMQFKQIKEIVRQLPDKKFTVNTNGLLLSQAKLKFIEANNLNIILSWDGVGNCQALNRGYSLDQIEKINKNLKLLSSYSQKVQINLTVSAQTVSKLFINLAYIHRLGYKRINILPVFYQFWPEAKIKNLKFELNKILLYLNKAKDLELINIGNYSQLPLFKNCLLVDCDGKIFFSTAAIEKFFQEKRDYFAAGNMLTYKFSGVSANYIFNYNRRIETLAKKKFNKEIIYSTATVNDIFEKFIANCLKIINK